MNKISILLAYVASISIAQCAMSQPGKLGIAEGPVTTHILEPTDSGTYSTDRYLIKKNSRGVGSGEIVFLTGESIETLSNEFLQNDSNDYDLALQKTLDALAPLLGKLDGRKFVIGDVIDLPAQKLIRFHQVVETGTLPQSRIVASKDNEIQLVSLYSISPKRAKEYFERKLTDSELHRLFDYHASKYFESLGVVRTIAEEDVDGPNYRFLDQDQSSENSYRYVADFFYDGYVFIVDAISGELIRAGHMGAAAIAM
ncbi:MAG: hypothetical protein R6W80_04860 [Haliea sp.]